MTISYWKSIYMNMLFIRCGLLLHDYHLKNGGKHYVWRKPGSALLPSAGSCKTHVNLQDICAHTS